MVGVSTLSLILLWKGEESMLVEGCHSVHVLGDLNMSIHLTIWLFTSQVPSRKRWAPRRFVGRKNSFNWANLGFYFDIWNLGQP